MRKLLVSALLVGILGCASATHRYYGVFCPEDLPDITNPKLGDVVTTQTPAGKYEWTGKKWEKK